MKTLLEVLEHELINEPNILGMKKIEVHIRLITGGVELMNIIVCRTKKQACELLDISMYQLNNYGSVLEPRTKEAIANPFLKFAYYDSGWLREKKPDWYMKVMPVTDLENYIHQVNRQKYKKLFGV